jgi:hypothetical protein
MASLTMICSRTALEILTRTQAILQDPGSAD